MAITHSQQKFLKERLQTIRNSKPRGWDEVTLPKPAEVVAAERAKEAANKVIHRFDKKRSAAKLKRNAAIDQAVNACTRLILFGNDAKAAVKAIDRFERKQF